MSMIRIEAEVAGGIGAGADFDAARDPELLGTLHYEFAGWLGDELVETAGYWLVTERVADAIRRSTLVGASFGEVVVSLSPEFRSRYGDPTEQAWERLVPTGTGDDDFALEGRTRLLVSELAFELLRRFDLGHAEITRSDRPAPLSGAMLTYLARRGALPDDHSAASS